MMRRLLLIAIATVYTFALSAQADSDVLMTVGDAEVTVGEFKYIYEKNNGKNADYSQASLDEYVDLYTKFKLKVQRAKDMNLDTIVTLQKELEGYRNQLANSFLTDKEVVDKLLQEIYIRKKQDVKARHILIKVNPRGPDFEKEKAIKKLENIKQQLTEGKPFSELAKEYSDDKNSKNNGGSLGYLTANLPNGFYELENAIYDLSPGEVSEPIKTKLGYHIVKVDKKRPARGTILVAHIFRKVDKTERNSKMNEQRLMDSLYNVLEEGGNFDALVSKYSQDKTTVGKKGVLPEFGIGVYDSKFEDAAFALTKDGEFSKPIETSVGIHILRRIKKPALATRAEVDQVMKGKLKKYDRYGVAEKQMIERVKSTSQFRERKQVLDKFTASLNDEFYSYKWRPAKDMADDVLLSFGPNQDETIKDFAAFAKKQTRMRSQFDKTKPLKEAVSEVYEEFVSKKAFEYEQNNLEAKYPEFQALMREYSEGILLFEATKINVWDKANQDTVGLYEFYEKNKSQYVYEERAVIGSYIVNTTDKKQVKKVKKCAKKREAEKTLSRFNKDGVELVEYSEMTVEPGSKELAGLEFKKKSMSEPFYDEKNKKTLFKKIVRIEPSRRKSLQEARGYVVADYQDELEKEWIRELKNSYPVKIKNSVLSQMRK